MITIILPEWVLWVIVAMFTISAVLTLIQIYCSEVHRALNRNKETLRMIEKHLKSMKDSKS